MDSSILNQFRMTVTEKRLGLYGASVYKKGEGTVSHRWRSNDKVCIYSGSKTFTSLAVGICRDEGRLALGDFVADYFPEYGSVSANDCKKITIRDLLRMASGKASFLFSVDEKTLMAVYWAELFFREPQAWEPGERFFYSNACTYMLSRIVEKVSGATLRDFLVPRLFTPLGISNPQWHTCPRGHTLGATELFLTTDEYLRLGIILLSEGVYGEKEIVSKDYLKKAVSDIINSDNGESKDLENTLGYGYQLWRCSPEGLYRADGLYGQFCIVVPDKEAVIAITAHEERVQNEILRAVYDDILPRL